MPIRTRAAKSGQKKVFKRNRGNASPALNRAARSLNGPEADNLTPGMVTERFDRRSIGASKKKAAAIVENRRRRH